MTSVRHLLHLAWLACAAAVIVGAVLVTAARVLLPRLAGHPEAVSAWASRLAGMPLTIEAVSASWRGARPRIELSGIDIHHAEGAAPVRLEHAAVQIRPLASLLRWEPVPATLLLDGIRLTVERLEDGRLQVTGAAPQESDGDGGGATLARWLLARDDVRIQAARITWIDHQRGTAPLMIRDADLRLRNEGGTLAVRLYLRPSSTPGAEAQLLARIDGDPLGGDWSGWLRLTGAGLPLTEIVRALGLDEFRARGALTLAIDSFWQNGALRQANGKLSGDRLELGALQLATAQGSLSLTRDPAGQTRLAIRDLAWYRDGQRLPPKAIDLAWQQQATVARHFIGKVDLLPLREIAAMINPDSLPPVLHRLFTAGAPAGEIHDLEFGYFPDGSAAPDFHVSARFREVSLPGDGAHLPRASGLGGSFAIRRDSGELQLRSSEIQVHGGAGGPIEDVPLNEVEAALRWRRDGDDWIVMLPLLHLLAANLPVDAEGLLRLPGDGSPWLDLRATVGAGEVVAIPRLLPSGALSERTENWIRRAFAGGRIVDGSVRWRGALDRFAADGSDPQLEARLTAENLTLDFSPRWPPLERASMELGIDGRHLAANVSGGRILGGEIREARLDIADLGAPERVLTIEGQAQGSATAAINLIRASPLRDGAIARVADYDPAGNIELDLDLTLPLIPGSHSEVRGTARLDAMHLKTPGATIELTALRGSIEFTRDAWHSTAIEAIYDGLPVQLSAGSDPNDPHYAMAFTMQGSGDAEFIRQQLARHVEPVYRRLARTARLASIQGTTAWQAQLRVPRTGTGGDRAPAELLVDADLRGLMLDLPEPMAKPADTARPLSLRVRLPADDRARIIQARYGTELRAEFEVNGGPDHHLSRAAILLGAGESLFPDRPVFLIRGHADQVSLDDWWDLFGDGGAASTDQHSLPVDIDLAADVATLIGQRFGNLRITGGGTTIGWQFDIASNDLAGRFAMTRNPGLFSAALQHLRIMPRADQQTSPIDPRKLPSFAVTCDDLQFGEITLGAAKFDAHPDAAGLAIDSLQLRAPTFTANASGHWSYGETGHRSQVSAAVTGDDLGRLLEAFGYQTGAIVGGATQFDLAAFWRGSPAQFALANLDGSLRLSIERGRLLDLEPGTGRLFGLLSINNLGRRLLLDFGDLFGKGYSFNSIKGTFRLEEGHAYTSDFSVLGPSARIDISGRIGLIAADYDQRVSVTPEISGTLPLAGAIFGPAGIGVGAAVYLGEKIFRSIPEKFDGLLMREYTLTGTWQDPVLERIQVAQSDR